MKHGKRILSLVLCLAMAMSVMVVGAGAAFSDQASIRNTKAVEACVSLKIISGYPDGTYRPDGTITRAEMAKLICMTLSGGKAPAVSAPAKATFVDVRNTGAAWAEPFIEACRVQGIVSGVSADRFDPSGAVTATQAAKMLLGALGYAADKEGFTGSTWARYVNEAAKKAGLFEGLDLDPAQPLSRDNAAQMIWNALNATMVEYVTETVTIDGQTVTKVSRKEKLVGDTQTKLTLLSACGAEQSQNQTVERKATTAVLLEDATLSRCYSQLVDENGQISWVSLSKDQPLHRGDLVLLLEKTGDTARVLVPAGDTPAGTYGILPAAVLSQEKNALKQASVADASGVMAYQSIGGPKAEELLGLVNILARKDGWCQVRALSGGDSRTFWVPEGALSYDLDQTVLDCRDLP